MKAPVNKIIRFSSVDGPGNRTSVFLQGCCFECSYCHNPETIHMCTGCGKCVAVCPAGALENVAGTIVYHEDKCCLCDTCIHTCPHMASPRIRMMTAEEVMYLIRKNMPFIRGVTVSGGECTMHRDFCFELAGLCNAEGLNFLLDSNGSYAFYEDPELTDRIDGVMLDVKSWNEEQHISLTGRSGADVRSNLSYLAKRGKLEEVRTVVIPNAMDPEETICGVCEVLRGPAPDTRYKIIKYRPMGVREPYRSTLESPTDDYMRSLEKMAWNMGILNTVLL